MNCLIVDDESLAQDVIELHISKFDFLILKGKCKNAQDAFSKLNTEQIDVIFLDIKMPEITGLDFLKSLKHPPKIIFTTAYPEYAIDGFELEVVDFLLKPISLERFSKAVHKLKNTSASDNAIEKAIFIKSDRNQIKISPSDILYIEGLANYLKIYANTNEKGIITHSTFKNIENKFANFPYFLRVHKSYLINLKHISFFGNDTVTIGLKTIPIGNNYKELFKQRMRTLK